MFRRTKRVIRCLTIVSITKGWNCCHCHKGADSIPRIGLGSQELGVPLLVSSSLSVECAGPSGRRPRSSGAPPQSGAPEKQTCTWPFTPKVRQACWGVYIAGGGGCRAGSHRAHHVRRVVEGVMGGIFSRNLQARFLHTEID